MKDGPFDILAMAPDAPGGQEETEIFNVDEVVATAKSTLWPNASKADYLATPAFATCYGYAIGQPHASKITKIGTAIK